MRKIIAIAWKDTILRFTSPWEWMFFIIMPVIFTVILAGGTGGSADNRIRLAVVDQANSPLSAELVAALGESEAVRPDVMTLASAENQFSIRRVSSLLVIPPEFDIQHLAQGSIELELRQQPNNISALAAYQAVTAVIGRVGSAVEIARSSINEAGSIQPFASEVDRQAYFDSSLQAAQAEMNAAPQRVTTVSGAEHEQIEYDPRANSSAGQLITWVFVPLLGISVMFASERQMGTLRRLLTTPTQKSLYLFATMLGQVGMALVQMLLLVGFGILVMKVNWGHAPGALAVMLLSSILAGAALGTTLGTFVKTEGQPNGLSIMLGMTMALLGGCWYPIELFPQFVRTAVKILPTSWAMQGMLDIVLRGQGLNAILPEAGVLLGFAVVFFTIGIWRFRYE
jgi:ABC-2 type transport system permease protein